MTPQSIQQSMQAAVAHHQAGQLREAETLYRQILAEEPRHPGALHFLGVLAGQAGRPETAIKLIERALALDPKLPQAHSNLGLAFQAAGRSEEAIAAHLQAARIEFNSAEAHYRLGNSYQACGRLEAAAAAYRQAINLKPAYPEACNNLGNALQAAGCFTEAIAVYEHAVQIAPDPTASLYNLGNACRAAGRLEEAIAAYRNALVLAPDHIEAHNNLGNTLKALGRFDEAIAAYQEALRLQPDYAAVQSNLGNAFQAKGQFDKAIAAYREAVRLNPGYGDAFYNLGITLHARGDLEEAIAAFRQCIQQIPEQSHAHSALAMALLANGQVDEAIAACREAVRINPARAEAYNDLGHVLQTAGRIKEAIGAFEQALKIDPNFAQAHDHLGNVLLDEDDIDGAIASCKRAVELMPNFARANASLGFAFLLAGCVDEAVACFGRAVELEPGDSECHSSYVFALHFHPAYDAKAILRELRAWKDRHARPLQSSFRPHQNSRSPDRRLRIGYVSSNFRHHVVGYNLLPLLREHDRQHFEIFCYSNDVYSDAVTEEFRSLADRWRIIAGIPDERVAETIRLDQVDILVDLALHTNGNRLMVFARKPAPVQVTLVGYPGGTGLEAINYRLTDPYLDPPGASDGDYCEQSIRLPHSFWCYDRTAMMYGMAEPLVPPLPALKTNAVTFGCLTVFSKVNETALDLWAKVLGAVKESRLRLLAPKGSPRQRVLDLLLNQGIEPGRIEFVDRCARKDYLKLYAGIDIVLDTLPYNGHTTSLDALWMGVPVVTLIGRTVVGRAGFSQLSNLGLTELVASTPERFVEIAVSLAKDLARLSELRGSLRERMQRSPLGNAKGFALGVEAAFREMWRGWCGERA